MSNPEFKINRVGRLISVQLCGNWHPAIDIEYLSQLGRVMQRMRQSTWGIVVDLREWYIDSEAASKNTYYSLHLDRRNQIAECWVVREAEQAPHLDPFFADLDFKPSRVLNIEELENWATDNDFYVPESIRNWF